MHLTDGRTLSVPVEWYPRLAFATPEERANFELFRDGYAIYWPDLDEDLHVPGLLAGRRSMESQRSLERWKEDNAAPSERSEPEAMGKSAARRFKRRGIENAESGETIRIDLPFPTGGQAA